MLDLAVPLIIGASILVASLIINSALRHRTHTVFAREREQSEPHHSHDQRATLVAAVLADWLYPPNESASPEQRRRVRETQIKASLCLPEPLVVEISKLLQRMDDAKTPAEIVLLARRELGSDDGLRGESLLIPQDVTPEIRYDFFLSYCHRRDALLARGFLEHLEARGAKVWFDKKALPESLQGVALARELVTAAKRCDAMIFLDLQLGLEKVAIAQTRDGPVPVPVHERGSGSSPWQQFERILGKDIVDVHPPTETLHFSAPTDNKELAEGYPPGKRYKSTEDAVEQILHWRADRAARRNEA